MDLKKNLHEMLKIIEILVWNFSTDKPYKYAT